MLRRDIDRRPAASCRHCHGLWISGPALAETQLPADKVPAESRRGDPQPAGPRPRQCPLCATEMRSEQCAGMTIERCPACASVWLDAGEFDAVRDTLLKDQATTGQPRPELGTGWTAFDALTEATIAVLPTLFDG